MPTLLRCGHVDLCRAILEAHRAGSSLVRRKLYRYASPSEKFLGAELASPKRWKEMATQLEVNVKLPRRGSANV